MDQNIFDRSPFVEFRAYMHRVSDCDGAVQFRDIDLMDLYAVAPWVYVLDVSHGFCFPRFTFRFVGTGLCAGIGFEPTGKSLDDLDFGPGQEAWREAYRTIVQRRRPHILSMTHFPVVPQMDEFKKGQANCLLRLIYPTRARDGSVSQLIGIGQFIRQDHPAANRFFALPPDGRLAPFPPRPRLCAGMASAGYLQVLIDGLFPTGWSPAAS